MARRVAVVLCANGALLAAGTSVGLRTNPVRKVVDMLQSMLKKVQAEGDASEQLFCNFQKYCDTGTQDLTASIQSAEVKVAELPPNLEAAGSKKAQLEKALAGHKADRDAATKAMEEATALRNKDKDVFDKANAESMVNVEQLKKAIAALEKGTAGSFLQSPAATRLQAMISDSDFDNREGDRQTVLAFLDGSVAYNPASGEITGILKQMYDDMAKDQADAIADEQAAAKSYQDLMGAKTLEVKALTQAIEEKLSRVGQLGIEVAEMENDLEDTSEKLAEDKAFLADLTKSCGTRAAIHEKEKEARGEEMLALSETVKILNDDEALDIFKKTLPSSAAMSFLQVQDSSEDVRARARSVVDAARKGLPPQQRPRLDFIMLAMSGRKKGFDQIIKLIDKLKATLKDEQAADDKKREYCNKELDLSEDKIKEHQLKLTDIGVSMEETKEGISTLAEEIDALKNGIVELDKSVGTATGQRKKENQEFKQLMSDNGAAKELILFAKHRLAKFYSPATALVEEDQDAAPPPPPAVAEAYTQKSEGSMGVMQMMDLLVADLDKEMTVAQTEEKNSQEEYEGAMADSAAKRAMDTKSMTDKEGAKAGMEAALETSLAEHKSAGKELQAGKEYLMSLHESCDWLLQYFDTRKTARADEVDCLEKATAVLNGADYSFLQTAAHTARAHKFLRRGSAL